MTRFAVIGIGLLGQAISTSLRSRFPSASVLGLDRLPTSSGFVEEGLLTHFGQCDVRDAALVREYLEGFAAEIVFHTAAIATVDRANRNPALTWAVNLSGTHNLLSAAATVKPSAVVVMSTDKVLGSTRHPASEDERFCQTSCPYIASKQAAELLARTAFGDLPLVIPRCANLVGIGDSNLSRLVPGAIDRILSGQKPQVYAGQADVFREYVGVADAAEAIVDLAVLKASGRLLGTVFHVGSGERFNPKQIVAELLRIADRRSDELEIVDSPEDRRAELGSQWLDSSQVRRTLEDWSPRPIVESLREAFEHQSGHQGLQRGDPRVRIAA